MEETKGYSQTARFLHWFMAIIIIAVWAIGFYSANLRGDEVRGGTPLYIHKAIASTVILLVVIRLVYRLTHRYPALPDDTNPLIARAAHVAHLLLYLVAMLAVPISGWYWSSVAGHPIPFLGLFDLPALAEKNLDLYDTAMWTHRLLAWSAGLIIALHIAAVIKHHFFDKDDILNRMTTGRTNSRRTDR